jgi:hypothetical protein
MMIFYLISVISGVLIIMFIHEMCSRAFICIVHLVGGWVLIPTFSFFLKKKIRGEGFY